MLPVPVRPNRVELLKVPPRAAAPRGRVIGTLPAPTLGIGVPAVGAKGNSNVFILKLRRPLCLEIVKKGKKVCLFACYKWIGAHAVLFF